MLFGLAVGALLTGCPNDTTTPSATTPDPSVISPAKSDCPDCDPAGPGAFQQTGLTSTADAWYSVGDTWQVAWRYTPAPTMEKRDEPFVATDTVVTEAYLFTYTVQHTDKDVFDNVLRQTARIEVNQGFPSGPHADLFSAGRLDRVEKRVAFVLNDLLDPVSETVFTVDYPNGKDIELDGKSSLRTGASIFPRTIPRVLVANQVDSPAPEVVADLKDIVDAMDPDWGSRQYIRVNFDNGDVVYWTRGADQFWPFYVETAQGAGVLVSYN